MSGDLATEPPPAPSLHGPWAERMAALCEETGDFQPLGARHWAFFHDDGPVLVVTFETLDQILARGEPEAQVPLGLDIARARGWSHLCLIADGPTYWRDRAIYRHFDRLVDDAFFEDFDRVAFYGAGAAGYAACAYSVAAPGATVLAVQPRATLDPALAGWDNRDRPLRRLNFTDRYGYAPDMTEGAARVFVVHDPAERLDAMHAALFARPHVTMLRCRHMGADVAGALAQMGVLPRLIEAAAEGTLTAGGFHRLYRMRRRHGPYLRAVESRLEQEGRLWRAALWCRGVTRRMSAPRFRRRLAELEPELARRGLALPPLPAAATAPAD
ncbi:MAG: phosphoadenosine phosphosulfate reductase [Rhodobacterales bacterium]|nr:phosphoadenosine phosphosulfate reductase [Rhodobacterales bacterium]